MSMNIHATAIVSPKAILGTNVSIGPMAVIDEGVQIGDNCVIGTQAVILKNTTLGNNCQVHSKAVIGDLPQDTAYKGRESYVSIASGCIMREGVTIHRGTGAGTTTTIGADCFFMVNSHVGHNSHLEEGVIVANGALLGGYVEVGAHTFISGNSLIHQFVRIGRLAMLGGGSALSKDLPPFCMVHSLHANQVAGLNIVGLRRAGMSAAERMEIKRAFNWLYLSGLNTTRALEEMRKECKGKYACELIEFVENSKRGICRHGSWRGALSEEGDDPEF